MSRDIRSYFNFNNKNVEKKAVEEKKPRKKANVIVSDEDELDDAKPLKEKKLKTADSKKAKEKSHSKKRTIASSEEDEPSDGRKKKAKIDKTGQSKHDKKEEEITPENFLSSKPVKRVNAVKVTKKAEVTKETMTTKPKINSINSFEEDDDLDATLNQLDTSQFEDACYSTITKIEASLNKSKEKNTSDTVNTSKTENKNTSLLKATSDSENEPKEKKKKKNESHKNLEIERDNKLNKSTEKEKSNDYNDIIEEKIEKKKHNAILYHNYLNRGGARNPGSKEIPQGAEQCLANLSFLITGVLESLEREEADALIKQYGGRILHSVSKKLNYIIVGEESGPTKLAKAESLGIKKLTEDGLLELIRTRPGTAGTKETPPTKENKDKSKKSDVPSPKNKKVSESSTSKEDSSLKNNLESTNNDVLLKNESSPKVEPRSDNSNVQKVKSKLEKTISPIKDKINGVATVTVEKKEIASSRSFISDISNKAEGSGDVSNKVETSGDVIALVEKYRPKELKQIIGQTGEKSNAKKLHYWLNNWHKNHGKNSKATKPKFSSRDDTGTIYKAALLSGPPGIGKTTTAYVVCAQLGYEILEFNASDTRSKKLLQEEIAGILSNKTVKSFLIDASDKNTPPKHVLLMDEVDGMAGNEDRGGMQELIAFIKSTEVPIICICNDRNSQKIKTLANYTFDLRFQKPRLEQIRGAMMSLCFKEGIKINPDKLTQIIQSTNQDIRQVINHIAMLSANSETTTDSQENAKYKNLKLGPWDVIRKVFSSEEHKKMSIHDKSDLFFHDYSIAPLFVEENYLSVTPAGPKTAVLQKIAGCSESLAIGDTIENNIRGKQAWSLLPVQACFSSVIPGSIMSGYIHSQINFPSWLGKNSKKNKCDRLLQDITVHARITTGASKEAINLDYLKMLVDSIVRPLAVEGTEGVDKAIEIMNKYHLSREDLDSLIELTKWPHTRDPMQSVDSKVKTAFTKAYNKSAMFSSGSAMKKKSSRDNNDQDFIENSDEENVEDNEESETIENDKLIKAKVSKVKSAPSDSKTKKTTKSNTGRSKKK